MAQPVQGRKGRRSDSIEQYRAHILKKIREDPATYDLGELRGKELGCWCKPKACHGDVLKELVDAHFGDDAEPQPQPQRPSPVPEPLAQAPDPDVSVKAYKDLQAQYLAALREGNEAERTRLSALLSTMLREWERA